MYPFADIIITVCLRGPYAIARTLQYERLAWEIENIFSFGSVHACTCTCTANARHAN